MVERRSSRSSKINFVGTFMCQNHGAGEFSCGRNKKFNCINKFIVHCYELDLVVANLVYNRAEHIFEFIAKSNE